MLLTLATIWWYVLYFTTDVTPISSTDPTANKSIGRIWFSICASLCTASQLLPLETCFCWSIGQWRHSYARIANQYSTPVLSAWMIWNCKTSFNSIEGLKFRLFRCHGSACTFEWIPCLALVSVGKAGTQPTTIDTWMFFGCYGWCVIDRLFRDALLPKNQASFNRLKLFWIVHRWIWSITLITCERVSSFPNFGPKAWSSRSFQLNNKMKFFKFWPNNGQNDLAAN